MGDSAGGRQSGRKLYIAKRLTQMFNMCELFQDTIAIGLASSHTSSVNILVKYFHALFFLVFWCWRSRNDHLITWLNGRQTQRY